jgi:uridine kinase
MKNLLNSFTSIPNTTSFPKFIAQLIEGNEHKVIAIFGPSGGGKTTFAQNLIKALGDEKAVLISVDDYWRYTREEMKQKGLTGYDWEARDKDRFLKDLQLLKRGMAIDKPLMDYIYEKPAVYTERIEPKEITILEATLDFTGIADLIIFTFAHDDIIFQRRIERDKDKKAFPTLEALEKYVRNKSIPAYKERLLPLVANANFAIDTHENKLYLNKNL